MWHQGRLTATLIFTYSDLVWTSHLLDITRGYDAVTRIFWDHSHTAVDFVVSTGSKNHHIGAW